MDIDKSTSTTASLKKLQDDGTLPGRGTMQREIGGIEPEPILGRMMEPNRVSGCVGFRLRDRLKLRYIPFQCPSSRSKWRERWFYLQIENSDPVLVVPEEQPNKIPEWTAKPALTPSLQSFIDIIDDLRIRGLSGYEVAADFVGRRIQPLQACAHPAFDYSGPDDATRVSPRGLDSDTVARRVSQVMISAPATVSDIPVPLCEKGPAEREAVINAAALLKEGVTKEASDVAAAATTSGSNVPKNGRKFSSVLGTRRAARVKAAQGGTEATTSASPAAASTDVVVATRDREVTPSSPAVGFVPSRGLPADTLTWEELHAEMERILQAGARGVGREIEEARAAAASANQRAEQLARNLVEAHEDLLKMRELVADNERQQQGLEHWMSELENNLSEIRGSLRVSYTGLHQLAGECGVTTTIPASPVEFSQMSSLAELATVMGAIPSKHAARIGEETSNGIYTRACHILACVRLAHPDLDLKKALDQGAVDDARKGVIEDVDDLRESVLPLFEENVDVEDVQQRGHPEMPVVVLALALEPYVPREEVGQSPSVEANMALTSLELEDALADRDRRIQYWKTKLEVVDLERTMVEVKKDQAVEALRGREVWFNSYLKSCYTTMAGVCQELRLKGISKHIDETLKQECRRASRYAGGHVLASIRDHHLQLHLEFLHEGFSRSRRTSAEIDGLAQSMAPLAEKVVWSMDWRWPSCSVGSMASEPYTRKKGVSLLDVVGMYYAVCPLNLSIALRVRNRGKAYLDSQSDAVS
uniref:Transposon protein, putative, unclassified n=2 Tax=Oryza sativa subsp. japonica TaxID=39947 RepID=Q53N57_ORYSJ|nr:transposon protein, putative, unclassified [Oryza sativa Japonica Group]ABA92675.1 transposon protein, putative, unclassified [Oryza sativa Japonica Group]